jgi:hypothetical protein
MGAVDGGPMLSNEIEITGGRVLRLERLEQWLTYEGLLEGTPSSEENRAYLAGIVARRSTRFIEEATYLVKPEERSANRPGVDVELGWLPRVTCVGAFSSNQPARDNEADISSLRIIWLQPHFAFPIAPEPLAHILAMDWNAQAADGWI